VRTETESCRYRRTTYIRKTHAERCDGNMSGNNDLIEGMERPYCGQVTDLGGEYDVVLSSKETVGDVHAR
jgi:hypothetical protein